MANFNEKIYKKAVIVDLDGTLSDSRHRDHLAKKERWDEFNALCTDDPPILPSIAAIRAFAAQGYTIIIFTGRQETCAPQTIEWLTQHNVPWHMMEMRRAGDFTPSEQLKKTWYWQYHQEFTIECVFEDSPKVIEMWHQLGLHCFMIKSDVEG